MSFIPRVTVRPAARIRPRIADVELDLLVFSMVATIAAAELKCGPPPARRSLHGVETAAIHTGSARDAYTGRIGGPVDLINLVKGVGIRCVRRDPV